MVDPSLIAFVKGKGMNALSLCAEWHLKTSPQKGPVGVTMKGGGRKQKIFSLID